jgi:hypothetical protein
MRESFSALLSHEHPGELPHDLFALRAAVPDLPGASPEVLRATIAVGRALVAAAVLELSRRDEANAAHGQGLGPGDSP